MLILEILFYKKFKKDLEITGLEFNPYNPCVANNIMHRKKLTATVPETGKYFYVENVL